MPESDGGLRQLFRKRIPYIHWVTIESRYTQSGIPDSNGCYAGKEFWIEYKKSRKGQVKVRPLQSAWIQRRLRCGGTVFVAVRWRDKGRDELWLLHGAAVKGWRGALRAVPAGRVVACWPGGPARWPWPTIAATLLGQ